MVFECHFVQTIGLSPNGARVPFRSNHGSQSKWTLRQLHFCHIQVVDLHMPPNTNTVPHNALDHTNIMRPPRRIMRDPDQRIRPRLPLCSNYYASLVIRYLCARLFQQLRVYCRWERPRWTARGCGFVGWKLEADEFPVLCEKAGDALCPCWAQGGRERA